MEDIKIKPIILDMHGNYLCRKLNSGMQVVKHIPTLKKVVQKQYHM